MNYVQSNCKNYNKLMSKSKKKLNNSEIGRISEDHASLFLNRNGYIILERNWRHKKAEIDIIASKNSILTFVEVKSRSSIFFGEPESAIDNNKESLLFAAAQRYMEQKSYEWAIRFDVISIILDSSKRPILLKHLKDVFF